MKCVTIDFWDDKGEIKIRPDKDSEDGAMYDVSVLTYHNSRNVIHHILLFIILYQKLKEKLNVCKPLIADSSCDAFARVFLCIRDAWTAEKDQQQE